MAVLMSDGRIAEPQGVNGPGLFQLAFRPFFLGGALFSVVAATCHWHPLATSSGGMRTKCCSALAAPLLSVSC